MDQVGRTAAISLMNVLVDRSQPLPVREEAAESAAYVGYARTVPALISVLEEPEVRIRFWAVFALGSIARRRMEAHDHRRQVVIRALEGMLDDNETPQGWWSVRREALDMLSGLVPKYRPMLKAEMAAVLNDPEADTGSKRWAGSC